MVKVHALISRFPNILGSYPKYYDFDIKLAGVIHFQGSVLNSFTFSKWISVLHLSVHSHNDFKIAIII